MQSSAQAEFPRIDTGLNLSQSAAEVYLSESLELSKPSELRILDSSEEIYMAQAVFLFGYLRRANAAGFFLCLSGGLDSSTVALFVFGG
jgi:NAD+ synthase (glutamine-hydrolysing)